MNNNKPNNKNGMPNKMFIIITLISALFIWYMYSLLSAQIRESTNIEKPYSFFMDMLEDKEVKSVKIQYDKNKIVFVPKEQPHAAYDISYYTGYIDNPNLLTMLRQAGVEDISSDVIDNRTTFMDILGMILPFVAIYAVMWFIFRAVSKSSGGVMGIGKSNAKVYVEKSTGVTFKDVAGQEEAKESLTEIVDFLHNPTKYTRIGAKLPKGALLVGPPGTGKTLLAKAIAGEAKVPFFSLSGSDFVEMFVGVGASRVRDLFKQAQQMAPCIIFIDEIDAIGKSRDVHYGGGNDEREQTLNQLLSNMDGFDSSKGLVVLGATNRPEVLDKALLRPGRFDRRIIVDKPDLKGRVDVLKVHAKNVLMHDSVDLDAIARATSGAVGSDLANMINEAAILAVKKGRSVVTQEDLFESVEVVIAGKEKKDRILSKEEKRIVAYHEVGHALVTALEKHSEPVQKITIVPRTLGALGYVMQVPEEEKFLMSQDELLTRIVTLFGGRAAEKLVFNSITTGASNDIEQATSLARAMVTQYGMSDKFGLMGLESVESKYLDGRPVMHCGEETASEIDKEVMRILKECYDRAEALLAANRKVLDAIAEHLIAKETITGEEFMEIYREVTGSDDGITGDGKSADDSAAGGAKKARGAKAAKDSAAGGAKASDDSAAGDAKTAREEGTAEDTNSK
jgi:cell division protease FtsH